MNIAEHYKLKPYKGDVGVEIEIEGRFLAQRVKNWSCQLDNSLRGDENMEYVTTSGVKEKEIDDRIDTLKNALKKSRIDDSVRAGVHVHLNFQNNTHTEVLTFATLWYIFEEILVDYCGEGRSGNLFCLRYKDAFGVQPYIEQAVVNKSFVCLHTDNIRYAALNFKPIASYGSLEVRCFKTPQDLSKVGDWAKILLQLKKASLQYANPSDVISEYSLNTTEDFIKNNFGEYSNVFLNVDNLPEKLRNGMYNAQDIAFLTNWKDFEEYFSMRGLKKEKQSPYNIPVPHKNRPIGAAELRRAEDVKIRKKIINIIDDKNLINKFYDDYIHDNVEDEFEEIEDDDIVEW